MVKGSVTTDAITIVGMIAISGLMFAQVPGMIDDIKETLSQQSVHAKAVEIADLLSLVSSSTGDMKITYSLSADTPYTITVKDGIVTAQAQSFASNEKTMSPVTFGPDSVKTISITKNGIEKVE